MQDLGAIDDALRAAGEPELVQVWRRSCRELQIGPRLALVSLTAKRAAQALPVAAGAGAVVVGLDPTDDTGALPAAIRDPLLGVHGLLWVTDATQPLGERERAALALLDGALVRANPTGPALARAVFVRGASLLARLSDDAVAERADVMARLATLVPPGWRVTFDDDDGLARLLDTLRATHAERTSERLGAAAAILISEARQAATRARDQAGASVARAQAALADEDAALEQARAEGRRAAAYTLAVTSRHTEAVRAGLRALLLEVERDLPQQIDSLQDLDLARRAFPLWIEHVVTAELAERIQAWQRAVHDELAHVPATDRALAHAELLLPAIQPAAVPAEGRWRRAVGLTAGVGGAVVLAALQLWIPAAIAASSGVAWSMLDRDPAEARRDRLVERARAAVRDVASQTDDVLAHQIAASRAALADLGDEHAATLAQDRAEIREALKARLRLHQTRHEQAQASLETFERAADALDLGAAEPEP